MAGIRDVFNLAGRFEFGLDERQARRANVDAPLHLARWAAGRPGLRRFIHVSGYRVGGMLAADEVPLSGPARSRLYAQLGGYEASKREGDATLRAEATGSGLPLTLVTPSTDRRRGARCSTCGTHTKLVEPYVGSTAPPAGLFHEVEWDASGPTYRYDRETCLECVRRWYANAGTPAEHLEAVFG